MYRPKPAPMRPVPRAADWPRVPGVYWQPTEAFVDELAAYLQGQRVLEIFAGNGLLAGLLAARGVEVRATSILSGMDAHERGLYHPVEYLDAISAVDQYGGRSDVLLVCWPTTTSEAVTRAVRRWGDRRDIVFIGEMTDYSKGHLGSCATDSFFEGFTTTRQFAAYAGRCSFEQAVVGRFADQVLMPFVAC